MNEGLGWHSASPRKCGQAYVVGGFKLFSRSKASFRSLLSHAASRQGRKGKAQTTRWTQCQQREGTSAQLQSL